MSDVLYNRHRPSSFSEVIGQDHVIKVIESHLANGTLPHSLIFYGPFGTGKTSTARILSSVLNPSPHGLIEKDSTNQANMEYIRSLQQDVEHKPFAGDYKTYIFDEAHRIPGKAFDALLKTIEEPPEHVKFIFVTSQFNSIPKAIRSRSECHGFTLIPNSEVRDRLNSVIKTEGKKVEASLIDLIVSSSGGSLRDALVSLETVLTQKSQGIPEDNIIKALGMISSSQFSDLVYAHLVQDFVKLDDAIAVFNQPHVDPEKAISDLQEFIMDFRRASIYSAGFPDAEIYIRSDIKDLVAALPEPAVKYGPAIDAMYDLTIPLLQNLRIVQNKKALFDRLLINLGLSWS